MVLPWTMGFLSDENKENTCIHRVSRAGEGTCRLNKYPIMLIQRTAKPTLTPVELDIGDTLRFTIGITSPAYTNNFLAEAVYESK